MKSTVESLAPTRVKLSVEVPFEELKPSIEAAYRTIGAQVQVPGFRKGKVPSRIIDQRVGRGAVLQEAINEALPGLYQQAVTENSVRVLGRPEVDISEVPDPAATDGELKFTAEVDVRPTLELPDLSALHQRGTGAALYPSEPLRHRCIGLGRGARLGLGATGAIGDMQGRQADLRTAMRDHATKQAAQGQLTIAVQPQAAALVSIPADGPGAENRLHRPGKGKGLIVEPAQRAQLAEQFVKGEMGARVDPDLAMRVLQQLERQIPDQRQGVKLGQFGGKLGRPHAGSGGKLEMKSGRRVGAAATIDDPQSVLVCLKPEAHGDFPCRWRPLGGLPWMT